MREARFVCSQPGRLVATVVLKLGAVERRGYLQAYVSSIALIAVRSSMAR